MELQQLYGKSGEWRELMEWLTVLIQAFVEILVVTSNAMRPPSKQLSWKTELQNLQDLALENEIGACEMDEYGHFIGFIEQPTPMPEGDLQMLRLGVSRRNKEDEVLWAIEDLIGESQSWPGWIRGIFWMDHLRDVDSLRLVTFCMGNGLPPHLLFQLFRVRDVCYNAEKLNDRIDRVRSSMRLEDGTKSDYFYWSLCAQEYCFMNGDPRNALTKGVKPPKQIPFAL